MKKLSLGILAHVDAGKTTLTESLLFDTGMIRSAGRVDNGDAFLDTETLEKKRGVTILSKQAICKLNKDDELNDSGDDIKITIIDTPGHTDFIGEAERVLGILDIAVLLVSGPDGVTASTKRLAGMLKSYKVPYFVFVNKMDMCQRSENEIIAELSDILGEGFLKYEGASKEDIAALSESTIEKYLEEGNLSDEDIENLIFGRRFHPVIFGSALKNTGVDFLIKTITRYIPDSEYRKDFSAKIFKVGYEDGHKLAFAKITGGSIFVRNEIDDERLEGEKITQIRCYSGGKYENTDMAEAGDVVTFVGLESAYAGMGLGGEFDEEQPLCQPVLRYDLELPIDVPLRVFLPKLKELAMEDPLLGLEVSDDDRVSVSVMGEFQMEILKETIKERFDVSVNFVKGSFVYKETIKYPVIGYGHFEPLRHYSEVQILMEPLAQGNGIEVASDLSVNDLDINWQKTIISTITEHLPVGVLTGAQLTDIRFTLIAGKAHLKHTDSQDFRESVRRAIRQGLMKTESLLLEP
ncbi:MAG: GTP-binding protein, partial [Eubacterium sp.]|nr:GTP-binding protein [Eubacterium sp.]